MIFKTKDKRPETRDQRPQICKGRAMVCRRFDNSDRSSVSSS